MHLILFKGIYVMKYQIIVHFRGWVGTCSRGRLSNNLVSRVDVYSRVGAYSRGLLNRSIDGKCNLLLTEPPKMTNNLKSSQIAFYWMVF